MCVAYDGRILQAVRLTVGYFTFFKLLNDGQLKGERVISLSEFNILVHYIFLSIWIKFWLCRIK